MKNRVLKLGFIGGSIHSAIGTTHKIASQMDSKFQLIAGAFSRDEKTNTQTADKWMVPRSYTDYMEFLEQEKDNLDAIVVLTPTDQHTQIILDVLALKIPVICEKTLTNSLKDAIVIKEKLKETNGFLVTTYNYTGYPMIRELERMVSNGTLGKINQVHIQMPQESFIRLNEEGEVSQPQSWRLRDAGISTLSLDLGTHASNMISFLTKEKPEEVIAMQNSYGHHNVVDNLICLVKYSNNIDCQMWYSKSALGHKNGLKIEIYGENGSASWYQMNPEFLEVNDNRGRNVLLDRSSEGVNVANQDRYNRFKSGHPAGFIEAFANYYDDIYESLWYLKNEEKYSENKYLFDVNASIVELTLMEAIEQSIKTKQWEVIDVED